jgi:hypothetical protein
MWLNIAKFSIEIDDNLLCRKSSDYLQNFAEISSISSTQQQSFRVSLSDDDRTIPDVLLTERLESSLYSESPDNILIKDEFSCLEINFKLQRMFIKPQNSRYLEELDILTDLKVLLSFLAIEHGGLLLHSSAVHNGEEALLFMGKSGAGKSTIAQILSSEWDICNDEFNLLLPEGNTFILYPSPFGTYKEIPGNRRKCYKPIHIFSICKSTENSIFPISRKQSIMELFKNICTFPSTDSYSQKLITNVHSVVEALPIELLLFSKNESLISFFKTWSFAHGML